MMSSFATERSQRRRRRAGVDMSAQGSREYLLSYCHGRKDVQIELINLSTYDSNIKWQSLDNFCSVRCGPSASRLNEGCQFCECNGSHGHPDSRRRVLTSDGESNSATFTFASCGSTRAQLALNTSDDLKQFAFNAQSLFEAKRAVLLAEGSSALRHCRFGDRTAGVQTFGIEEETAVSDDDTESTLQADWATAYYIKSKANGRILHDVLKDVLGADDRSIYWVSGVTGMHEILLTKEEYRLLLQHAKEDIEYITAKPDIFKISPALLGHLEAGLSESLPIIQVFLNDKVIVADSVPSLVASLNRQFSEAFGALDLVYVESNGAICVKPLKSAVHYTELLRLLTAHGEIAGIHERVEYLIGTPKFDIIRKDPRNMSTNVTRGYRQLYHDRRRLDTGATSIIGSDVLVKSKDLTGKGVIAVCADTGAYVWHEQFITVKNQTSAPYNTLDMNQRKIVSYIARANDVDESELPNGLCGHGTHVCGSIAGSSQSGEIDDVGVAPGAKLIVVDVGLLEANKKVDISIPTAVSDLFEPSYTYGARVFSFSWGSRQQIYDMQAFDLDAYLHSHEDVIVLLAAGNDGDGSVAKGVQKNCAGGLISTPAIAKNVITIGASVNLLSTFDVSACPAYNENNLASFSSMGPAPDGRRKPEIVCPGFSITSAQSLSVENSKLKTYASGTCQNQGTSQAAPTCAGAAVLVYQWLIEGRYGTGAPDPKLAMTAPSSALIKALLVHSAVALKKYLPDTSQVTKCAQVDEKAVSLAYGDNYQGFGRVNLLNIIKVDGSKTPFFVPNLINKPKTAISEGVTDNYDFSPISCSTAFKAVLAWVDPAASSNAGNGCESQLVNDLDLSVVITTGTDTVTFYPVGATKEKPDAINNLEVVIVPKSSVPCDTRQIKVLVTGSKIRVGGSQKYALVASDIAADPINQDTTLAPGRLDGWQPYMTALVIAGCIVSLLGVAIGAYFWFKRRFRPTQPLKSFAIDGNPPGDGTVTGPSLSLVKELSVSRVLPPHGDNPYMAGATPVWRKDSRAMLPDDVSGIVPIRPSYGDEHDAARDVSLVKNDLSMTSNNNNNGEGDSFATKKFSPSQYLTPGFGERGTETRAGTETSVGRTTTGGRTSNAIGVTTPPVSIYYDGSVPFDDSASTTEGKGRIPSFLVRLRNNLTGNNHQTTTKTDKEDMF